MRIAWRELTAVAVGVVGILVVAAHGYGYHRDELYFIAIGGHPAWGYVDQPPLVPLLAHAMDALPGGLTVFRLPSALATGLTVLVTGLTARELGAGRGGQVLSAACLGVSAVAAATGHLVSTTAYDVLAWAVVVWLAVRGTLRDERAWLLAGIAAGVGLEVKSLIGFLLLALGLGVLLVGPRRLLRSPWVWAGVAAAVILSAPNLIWQATHGWPQLRLADAIAAGGSGTSEPRWLFVPYQLVLVSPVLVPVWVVGLVRLLRSPALRPVRFVGVAYLLLLVTFLVTAGKPYYLAGMFPVLLAAGADPVVAWASSRLRTGVLVAALALSLVVSAVLFLPVVPADRLAGTPVPVVNYDAGETVGWPRFVATVAGAADRLPADGSRVVLTGNYGEAGALMRARPDLGVYSGHNALWDIGPPPAGADPVVAVGLDRDRLQELFRSVRPVAVVDNGVGLDNEEQGEQVWLCAGLRRPWDQVWPSLRRLG